MKIEELNLKAFDALLQQYHKLYLKYCAGGSINEDEFEELKRLFVEACHMAETLLRDFVKKYDDTATDDFDTVLEQTEHWGVLHYSCCWKELYHERLPHIEENRMTPKDRDRLISAYDLLKIPNYTLAAWLVMEKENGVIGKENPKLLYKLYNYFSEHNPYRNGYPGCSFTTQAEMWHKAETHDYGDVDPDEWECYVWEYFKQRMEEYMAEHGLQYPFVIPAEIEDKLVCSHDFHLYQLYDDVGLCILSAMKENLPIEIVYFRFEKGASHLSTHCITPTRMIYTNHYWTLIGTDETGQTKEFIVLQILEIEKNRFQC